MDPSLCRDGRCQQACCASACVAAGRECGSWDDLCDGLLECGQCDAGELCAQDGRCEYIGTPLRLVVPLDKAHTVRPHILGVNGNLLNSNKRYGDPKLVKAFVDLGLTFGRFPGAHGLLQLLLSPRVTAANWHSITRVWTYAEPEYEQSIFAQSLQLMSPLVDHERAVRAEISGGHTYEGNHPRPQWQGQYPELNAGLFFTPGETTATLVVINKLAGTYLVEGIETTAGQILPTTTRLSLVPSTKADYPGWTHETATGARAAVIPPFSASRITVTLPP